MITRHVLTVRNADGSGARKVHYRKCGKGPALLMIHQSPRSSAEYEDQMRAWGEHFTCIAPDTPGFGQSDPLPEIDGRAPEIDAFADGLAAFIEALGIAPTLAYGFHSGAVILMTTLKRHPGLFRAIAMGGYAVWTAGEMELFGERYLPEFHPSEYGEHLTWLWHRIMEQSWFFPWFDTRDEARLPNAHADAARAQEWVDDLLDAGNAYRAGYGAVLNAPRDIPESGPDVPPCLITAYYGDPLEPHIDRLGVLPANWSAYKVDTPEQQQADSLAFLLEHRGDDTDPSLAEDEDEGWIALEDGLIHWRGTRGTPALGLHPPASQMPADIDAGLMIDAPGHGSSDTFDDPLSAVEAAAKALGCETIDWPEPPAGDPDLLYPDLTPDRFGAHLGKAWSASRAEAFFEPWYLADRDHAIAVDQTQLTAHAIHDRALARLRAGREAALAWHKTLTLKQTPNGDTR